MFRAEARARDGHPLGDEAWEGEPLEVGQGPRPWGPANGQAVPPALPVLGAE